LNKKSQFKNGELREMWKKAAGGRNGLAGEPIGKHEQLLLKAVGEHEQLLLKAVGKHEQLLLKAVRERDWPLFKPFSTNGCS
jgi:hypothetical protein